MYRSMGFCGHGNRLKEHASCVALKQPRMCAYVRRRENGVHAGRPGKAVFFMSRQFGARLRDFCQARGCHCVAGELCGRKALGGRGPARGSVGAGSPRKRPRCEVRGGKRSESLARVASGFYSALAGPGMPGQFAAFARKSVSVSDLVLCPRKKYMLFSRKIASRKAWFPAGSRSLRLRTAACGGQRVARIL